MKGDGAARSRYAVGIDLGTTNSAVAAAEPARGGAVWPMPIPQVVADGEVRERDALASAIYLAGEHDVAPGALALPWRADERFAVGAHARRLGARVAGRLVTSAKSWLCHGGVDRTAAILPWGGAVDAPRLSPVAASARILEHLRDAWDAAHPDEPLASQDVVLTVPASFDEVARELTVRAAADAGIERLRLLEEPQAAIYAWISAHEDWRERLDGVRHVLVVDVGGGTTDFSLVAVRRGAGGLTLERVAVGDHLLLGGDNMDLALARRVAERRAAAASLDAPRWLQLVDQCREAKERLLGADAPEKVAISLAGRGRGVVSGAIADAISAEEAIAVVRDGFFPLCEASARPRVDAGLALAEFGLPFASEPEITRHLAAFLAASAERGSNDPSTAGTGGPPDEASAVPEVVNGLVVPDAVLFNGGALKPAAVRDRVLDAIAGWCGRRPRELAGTDLDLAVARGAAA
ncbi:MAG: Hsp70 family protein, partial [Alphaproteobacteria bacterium]